MHLKALNCVSANSKNVIKNPEEDAELQKQNEKKFRHGKRKIYRKIVKTNIVTLRLLLIRCYVFVISMAVVVVVACVCVCVFG